MSDPARGSPFRGGFRFEPEAGPDEGACVVEAWGASPAELLPRVLEAASNAAGGVGKRSGHRSLVLRADRLIEIVETLVTLGLSLPIVSATCDSAPALDLSEPDGLIPSMANWSSDDPVELCVATTAPGPQRLDLVYTAGSARVWREEHLLRTRFHVRAR